MAGRAEPLPVPAASPRTEVGRMAGLPIFLALALLPVGLLPFLLGVAGWAYGAVALVAGVVHLAASVRARPAVGEAGHGAPGRRAAIHFAVLGSALAADVGVLGTAGPAPEALPHLHVVLNAWAAVSLVAGVGLIRRDRREAHRACMLSAAAASAVFLASYLVYHAQVGSVPFDGGGLARTLYLAVLGSHVVLALAVLPAALLTLARALAGREEDHRRIARWTYPVWVYVSVTGLAVYWAVHAR